MQIVAARSSWKRKQLRAEALSRRQHTIGNSMKEKAPNAKVVCAILCDDVRKEENGKDIILGVYSGNVLIEKFPADLKFCLWLGYFVDGSGELAQEVRVIDPSGRSLVEGKIKLNIAENRGESASLALRNMPLHIEKQGLYKFQWRKKNSRWKTILEKWIDQSNG